MNTLSKQETDLRTTIKANAVFSGLSGLSLIIFKGPLANLMTIPNDNILMYIGMGLLVFTGSLLYYSFKKQLGSKEVKLIIYQDWGWVIGSSALIIIQPFNISLAGNIIIGITAIAVMGFALAQTKALSRRDRD